MKVEITEVKHDDGLTHFKDMEVGDFGTVVESNRSEQVGRRIVRLGDGLTHDFTLPDIPWRSEDINIRVRLMAVGESWTFTRTK